MIEERILRDIKELFVYIRFYASKKDDAALCDRVKELDEKYALVNRLSAGFQKDVLLYCFSNLKALFESRQYEFLYDFADAVHNLPEIFFRDFNLTDFWNIYIIPIRKKYGNHLFAQFEDNFLSDE